MKGKDLAALAALAGGLAAFKSKADKDYAELPEQKEVAERQAKRQAELNDFVERNRKATSAELSAARRQAAYEELNPEGRVGRSRTPMTDRYGNPMTTGTGGFAYTEMKKGGAVKSSASKRADGIAQRGKTKGRII